MEQIKAFLLNFAKNFGTNVLEAVAVLLLGIVIVRIVVRILKSLLYRTKIDGTAISFVASAVKAVCALVIFFLIMRIFSIDTTSIVAIVAASGLAIGLALQDSLSNIASGIILLFSKPFKENDRINVGGKEGVVKKIKITTTELLTFDNVSIIIPNGKVVSSEIVNYSTRPTRRLDLTVGVAYEADIAKVKETLLAYAAAQTEIMKTPEPVVIVSALGDSSVTYTLRVWTTQENCGAVNAVFLENVLKLFAEKNIEIPYGKLEVTVKEGAKND